MKILDDLIAGYLRKIEKIRQDYFILPSVSVATKNGGENLIYDVTLSTFCVECIKDPPKIIESKSGGIQWDQLDDKQHSKKAWFVYKGNGLCIRHFAKKMKMKPERMMI